MGRTARGAHPGGPEGRVTAVTVRDGHRGTVVHVAPHADDESIGAPATLMALRDAGWHVVNVTCSLGGPEERDRRRAEVQAACAQAGFALEVLEHLGAPLRGPDVAEVQLVLEHAVADVLHRHRPPIVVAPSPHDGHGGHEVVGRAALAACTRAAAAGTEVPRLWLWGLWADLPLPTVLVPFGEERLAEILAALECHAGELARNDYRRVVAGRAAAVASLGPERVFGFGSTGAAEPYAEVLCEVVRRGPRWHLGRPRQLDAGNPVGEAHEDATGPDVTDWLEEPSVRARHGRPG